MLVDVTLPLRDRRGNTPPDGAAFQTVRDVLLSALDSVLQGDEQVAPDIKYGWDKLARRITAQDSVDLRAEDVTLLKGRIGKMFTPLIIGQVFDLIDPPPMLKAAE